MPEHHNLQHTGLWISLASFGELGWRLPCRCWWMLWWIWVFHAGAGSFCPLFVLEFHLDVGACSAHRGFLSLGSHTECNLGVWPWLPTFVSQLSGPSFLFFPLHSCCLTTDILPPHRPPTSWPYPNIRDSLIHGLPTSNWMVFDSCSLNSYHACNIIQCSTCNSVANIGWLGAWLSSTSSQVNAYDFAPVAVKNTLVKLPHPCLIIGWVLLPFQKRPC